MKYRFFRRLFVVCGALSFVYYAALKISDPGRIFEFSLIWPAFGVLFFALFFGGTRIMTIAEARARAHPRRTRFERIVAGTFATLFLGISAGFLCYNCLPYSGNGGGNPEYLLVLGGGIKETGEVGDVLLARLDRAAEYIAEHPGITVIVSGGKLEHEPWPESYAMARYLRDERMVDATILEEGASLDTIQNFTNSLALIRERERALHAARNLETDPPTVCVLTSDFHLRRAAFLANRLGYAKMSGAAAPCPLIAIPNSYLRETGAWWKLWIRILAGKLPELSAGAI